MASQSLLTKLKPEELKEITTAFDQFDKDHDGFITGKEMKECLGGLHIHHDNTDVDEVITNMDANKDGIVSFDEYMNFMARIFIGPSANPPPSQPSKQRPKKK